MASSLSIHRLKKRVQSTAKLKHQLSTRKLEPSFPPLLTIETIMEITMSQLLEIKALVAHVGLLLEQDNIRATSLLMVLTMTFQDKQLSNAPVSMPPTAE